MALGVAVVLTSGYTVHRVTELETEVADLREALGESARASSSPSGPNGPPPTVASPPDSTGTPAGDEACEGVVSQSALNRTVGEHGRDVFACHAERTEDRPDLRGLFRISVIVDDEGEVLERTLDSSLDDPELERCVLERLEEWSFPRAENGRCAEVSMPFALGMEQR